MKKLIAFTPFGQPLKFKKNFINNFEGMTLTLGENFRMKIKRKWTKRKS